MKAIETTKKGNGGAITMIFDAGSKWVMYIKNQVGNTSVQYVIDGTKQISKIFGQNQESAISEYNKIKNIITAA